MIYIIVAIVFAGVMMTLSSFAKAHMDTIVFKHPYNGKSPSVWPPLTSTPYFQRYPGRIYNWLWTMETENKKKKWDGWHICQSVWYASFFIGSAILGTCVWLLVGASWWLVLAIPAAWAYRLACHNIGFSRQYPIK